MFQNGKRKTQSFEGKRKTQKIEFQWEGEKIATVNWAQHDTKCPTKNTFVQLNILEQYCILLVATFLPQVRR